MSNNQLMKVWKKNHCTWHLGSSSKCLIDKGFTNKICWTKKFFLCHKWNFLTQLINMLTCLEHWQKKLDAIGARVFEKMKVRVLLISLPKSYQHLITTLESLRFANHTWDDVCMKLVNEELMRNEKGRTSKATSFTHN
jgi:hypothetical protein